MHHRQCLANSLVPNFKCDFARTDSDWLDIYKRVIDKDATSKMEMIVPPEGAVMIARTT